MIILLNQYYVSHFILVWQDSFIEAIRVAGNHEMCDYITYCIIKAFANNFISNSFTILNSEPSAQVDGSRSVGNSSSSSR
mmetsp:Transcript_38910/g.52756  ORF Transcript_38910/g.52756 Transcript_38910/m.52756 type:complete len:80 (-) Transcript_38910:238-477(-)